MWRTAGCLKPDYVRCLVAISNGGKDAVEVREFDTSTGQFVADGFRLPEAKMRIDWLDRDTLIVGTDYGQGSLTNSGYPRILKLWKRGTPLASARTVYEGKVEDVWAAPDVTINEKGTYPIIMRGVDFFTAELYHMKKDGSLVRSPLPIDADFRQVFGSKAIALLRNNWTHNGVTYAQGSLVAYDIDALLDGKPVQVEQVFAPKEGQAISEIKGAKDALYVNVLDNVRSRLLALRPKDGAWAATDMEAGKDMAIKLVSAGSKSDLILFQREGYTTPSELVAAGDGPMKVAYALPARFDPSRFTVEQLFATSKDGTRVPYTVVKPKDAKGPLPTWMFAYGGFEIPLVPTYVVPEYQFWLEEGGAYVVANLRGGGEYGPTWHQAALRENRQRAYEDLFAVSEDLLRRGITTTRQFGLYGRSNGGLLTSVALTQRPDLFGAIISGVPLADMKRYHKLLAGASWMAEYGDPDNPADWAFISKYSPYQNLKAGQPYPQIFYYTSTKDDRVHPGHARKMAAKLEELGYPYFYYENTQGGHAGVANLKETAYRSALMLVYMNSQLKAETPVAAPRIGNTAVGAAR
ncbi:prolyl oligopeptidase family serine peptidase [Pedomonas mirosovicensis]|uniref:prolyl oligopeptidase family serine peptidase n=1 Tax=Pedomonas mirosovicensis TaxID=2908641 RepID=UPI0021682ACB|nr:prolyl oligopeptidase family serine peptidase [Pedomonas mirosovicensis]